MADTTEGTVWMTVPEALIYLKVSKTTLYSCMKDGRLPFHYIRGTRQRRIRRSDLDALLEPGSVNELEPTDLDET